MSEHERPDAAEFQDPLEDYEPRVYKDDFEQALAEKPVTAIRAQPFLSIPETTPVHAALATLAGRDIACTLVVDQDQRLVGVFSDRDTLDKVALEYDEVKDEPVSKVMTDHPIRVREHDSAAAALCVMASVGYRHVPIVAADEKVVGIVSPHRLAEFLQERLDSGAKGRSR